MAGKLVSEKRFASVKKKLATAYARNARQDVRINRLQAKCERQQYEIANLQGAIARAVSADKEGWARIAERQRIYIKSLEERLAGTWDPAVTHQAEWRN